MLTALVAVLSIRCIASALGRLCDPVRTSDDDPLAAPQELVAPWN